MDSSSANGKPAPAHLTKRRSRGSFHQQQLNDAHIQVVFPASGRSGCSPGVIGRLAIHLVFGVALLSLSAPAQSPRFIIDDDENVDKVTDASAKLLQPGKLKPLDSLRREVQTKSFPARRARRAPEPSAPE